MKGISFTEHTHTHNHVIHEHRAPTDASIALFKELQEKAFESVIHSGEIKDNVVNGTYHIIQGPPYNQVKIYIMFSINGEEFTTTRDIHIGDMLKSGGDKFDIAEYKVTFEKQVKQTILWYMLQYFATSVYKEITGYEVEKGEIVMAKGANPFK